MYFYNWFVSICSGGNLATARRIYRFLLPLGQLLLEICEGFYSIDFFRDLYLYSSIGGPHSHLLPVMLFTCQRLITFSPVVGPQPSLSSVGGKGWHKRPVSVGAHTSNKYALRGDDVYVFMN